MAGSLVGLVGSLAGLACSIWKTTREFPQKAKSNSNQFKLDMVEARKPFVTFGYVVQTSGINNPLTYSIETHRMSKWHGTKVSKL